MATSYSPFFSSGLLASYGPHTRRRRGTVSSDASVDSDSSGAHMDVDLDVVEDARGSATPTPRTTPVPADHHPRLLRRRRSSLTQAASPLAALRSPAARAGHALHAARARSGSLGGDPVLPAPLRVRSGSCSGVAPPLNTTAAAAAAAAAAARRPRRPVRRGATAPVPGLRAPPPTAPLPALPLTPTGATGQLRPAKVNFSPTAPTGATAAGAAAPAPKPATSARARGLSVSGSTMGGEAHRIDEMKEN